MPRQPHPLLGVKPSRKFKIYREKFPAIFRWEGRLYMEMHNIDSDEIIFTQISPEHAARWLESKSRSRNGQGL